MPRLKRYTVEVTFTYDPETDAAYIYLGDGKQPHGKTYRVANRYGEPGGHFGIYIDVNKAGAISGVELLGSELLPEAMRKIAGLK